MRAASCLPALLCLVLAAASCEQFNRLTATRIKDVLERPRDYENKQITIHGTVTDAASVLFVKYFTLRDDTGSIRVITDRVLPKKGERLTVTGFMESLEIGSERWVVLREKGAKPS
ncbi:MAG TPA: hypothetical protein VNN77_18375 [candidate division Zixibacteria bacterium]|nr:hypothetical protein [candidate division Zixibacteria bacterium]